MYFKCHITCTLDYTVDIVGEKHVIKVGDTFDVESQSIDHKQWYIYIPDIKLYVYTPKFHFDFLVETCVLHNKVYGEFQLPVIGVTSESYVCADPTGTVIWLHKDDIDGIKKYTKFQRIVSEGIKFL